MALLDDAFRTLDDELRPLRQQKAAAERAVRREVGSATNVSYQGRGPCAYVVLPVCLSEDGRGLFVDGGEMSTSTSMSSFPTFPLPEGTRDGQVVDYQRTSWRIHLDQRAIDAFSSV